MIRPTDTEPLNYWVVLTLIDWDEQWMLESVDPPCDFEDADLPTSHSSGRSGFEKQAIWNVLEQLSEQHGYRVKFCHYEVYGIEYLDEGIEYLDEGIVYLDEGIVYMSGDTESYSKEEEQ
jgi:hypothetical protein